MFQRDTVSYQSKQQKILKKLAEEAANGIIKCDTLPNKGQPLKNEVEAVYFDKIRVFFQKSVAHKIMSYNNDKYEDK